MSKKTTKGDQTAIEMLLADGTLTLTGESRADIYEQAEALVDSIPDGTKWTRNIVEFDGTTFSQTYFITKK